MARMNLPGRLSFCLIGIILFGIFSPDKGGAEKYYPSVTFLPLAYHYEDPDSSHTDILWPIYHQKRTGSHTRTAIRPFLFNYESDPDRAFRQVNVLWPLTHFEYEKETFRKWIFPLYYHEENDLESVLHLWPFFGHSTRSDGTESWTTLYPFFQYARNEAGSFRQLDYLWPLGKTYRRGETSGSYFFPLWWRKSEPGLTGGFVFPYFWHTTEERRQKGIFPLWYTSRSEQEETDFLLLWLSHRNRTTSYRTLFPLYWQKRLDNGYGFSLLIPFYGDYRSEKDHFRVLFPFYFAHNDLERNTTLRYLFPFYGDYRKGDHVRDRYYLFPLYVKVDDPEEQRQAWYFLWPLVYAEKTPSTLESWAIPFYWIDRQPERAKSMILGLYWSYSTPKRDLSMLFPFYYRDRSDDLYEVHYWPFYGLRVSDSYRERSIIWPLFRWGSNPAGDRKAWQLLLAYRKKTPEENLWGFFPLWHHQQNDKITRDISLLHWQERKPNGDRQFSLLHAAHPDWSIFSIRRRGAERHHHFFPLYSFSGNPSLDQKDFWLLGPLYNYQKSGADTVRHRLLWKVLYADRDPGKKEVGFLWRLIRSKREGNESLFEFHPFYYRETAGDGESYTAWLGGLYSSRASGQSTRKTLFWMINW